jgi:hypothetical protein
VEQLSACRVLHQVTELRLHRNRAMSSVLAFVADTMPQLVVLDLFFVWSRCENSEISIMHKPA